MLQCCLLRDSDERAPSQSDSVGSREWRQLKVALRVTCHKGQFTAFQQPRVASVALHRLKGAQDSGYASALEWCVLTLSVYLPMPGKAVSNSSETSTAGPNTPDEDIDAAEDLLWRMRAAHTTNDTLSRLSENPNFARRYHPAEAIDSLTCLLEGFTPDGSSALPFGIDFAAEHGVQLRSSEQNYRNVDRAVVCHIMDLTHIYTAFSLLEYPELWRGPGVCDPLLTFSETVGLATYAYYRCTTQRAHRVVPRSVCAYNQGGEEDSYSSDD
ncbi:uncharacterized protein MKK02DRAFT_28549 [Dioszegia hungarica]|uniref:Uncharacterized protein n=1 Tax=Dioszegia hungarica TaxID=4972 RepID=A0AA38LS48_9TREE|nr:uncharacterized protein MKK02DRAFT_28549 [Dioszegia hungarica]KAI9633780.1 hypothetical protein MKK02DRAFT_28549 [Dioszegia hungarica]